MALGRWLGVVCLFVALVVTASPADAGIRLQPVLQGLSGPVFVTHAGDGTRRIFVIEQGGRVLALDPAGGAPTVFLDIAPRVLAGGEQGLLGLAFHPAFASNGRFFVDYTRQPDGATVIAEYHVGADVATTSASETVLLTIPQPYTNHNGGMLAFGPDGMLYIGMGDGGSGNDPENRAQNIDELLGKILRIDIDHTANGLPYASPATNPYAGSTPGRDEIYVIGVRNPWRFSFDRASGALYLGDVGQGAIEEIDIVTGGGNYGWRVYEGTSCTGLDPDACVASNFVMPIAQYGHTNGRCSITGGYVYRGPRHTLPAGTYVFGDFCTGEIMTLQNGAVTVLLDTAMNISSVGEDEAGELYVVDLGGSIYRLAAATHDANGDANSDIAWHRSDGVNALWRFSGSGGTQLDAVFLTSAAPPWEPKVVADIDGDARFDIIWQDATSGLVSLWFLNIDGTLRAASYPATVPPDSGWHLAAAADITGDGRAELLWRHSSGVLRAWHMTTGGEIAASEDLATVPSTYELVGSGDFNGDGIDDLLWFQPSTGQVAIYLMHADGTFAAVFPGAVGPGNWRPQRVADFDGDGNADVLWRDEVNGATALWYLDGGTLVDAAFLPTAPPGEWQIGSVGDFDADGRADVAWYSPTSGNVVRWMLGARHEAPRIQSLPGVGSDWTMLP